MPSTCTGVVESDDEETLTPSMAEAQAHLSADIVTYQKAVAARAVALQAKVDLHELYVQACVAEEAAEERVRHSLSIIGAKCRPGWRTAQMEMLGLRPVRGDLDESPSELGGDDAPLDLDERMVKALTTPSSFLSAFGFPSSNMQERQHASAGAPSPAALAHAPILTPPSHSRTCLVVRRRFLSNAGSRSAWMAASSGWRLTAAFHGCRGVHCRGGQERPTPAVSSMS